MIDPLYGVIVLVCGMIGLWVVSIAFSINLMFWGRLMEIIKKGLSLLEDVVIAVYVYGFAVVGSFAVGSAVSLCLIIPTGQMLGLM